MCSLAPIWGILDRHLGRAPSKCTEGTHLSLPLGVSLRPWQCSQAPPIPPLRFFLMPSLLQTVPVLCSNNPGAPIKHLEALYGRPYPHPWAFLSSWRTGPLATGQAPCSAPPADPLKKGRGQKITHENQKQNPIGTTNGNGLGKQGPGMFGLLIKPCVPQPPSPREQARPAPGQACSF